MSAAGLALFAAASIIIVAGGSFLAVPWWRHYFRRVFDARMQLQEDGSYLAHWIRRGWKGEVYRIDALTKQRVLDGLTAGSVLSTALFVVLLVAAVAISVVCAMPIIAPAAMLLAPFAFAPQRGADREARRLILTVTRVDGAEARPPHAPAPAPPAKSIRLIILFSCLSAAMGVVLVATLANAASDADRRTSDWTGGGRLILPLLLVVLPLSVALFNLWALRRMRLQKNAGKRREVVMIPATSSGRAEPMLAKESRATPIGGGVQLITAWPADWVCAQPGKGRGALSRRHGKRARSNRASPERS
ncbi:MAG: hypothetical protein JOY67_05495 [Hyphomicrobiales bacterium]|nr:hypothetical protein [Hyphomicrobiales bacterium]